MSRARFTASWIGVLALVGFLLLGPSGVVASAEDPEALTEVSVLFYPEFDQPSLLVIVAGHLSTETPLPATLRMLMPTGATLGAAAFMGEEGRLVSAIPSQKPAATPGWDEVSFDVESQMFQFEYYHDAIEGGPNKSISFEYRFLYPVENLVLEAQQPLKATNYVVTPTQQTITTDNEGFRYYQSRIDQLEAAQPLRLQVSYTKTDPSTSVAPLSETSSTPATEAPDGTPLLIALGGGVVAVVAAVFIVWRRRRPAPALSRAQRRARTRQSSSGERPARPQPAAARGEASSQRVNFCRQCGARLSEYARFCPQCGETISG